MRFNEIDTTPKNKKSLKQNEDEEKNNIPQSRKA